MRNSGSSSTNPDRIHSSLFYYILLVPGALRLVGESLDAYYPTAALCRHRKSTVSFYRRSVRGVVLRSTEGPMEFEGLGFKFKGAAGPVVLWAMCFIVIVLGIRVLW
jgi:hypothetical protein